MQFEQCVLVFLTEGGMHDPDQTPIGWPVVVGVAVPMGPVSLGLNYMKRDTASIIDLGLNYSLSKRSSVYVDFGQHKSNAGDSKSQYNIVLVHNF